MLLLVLGSCTGTTREARRMVRRAERLADTLPDSTLRLIDSVLRMEVYFSERERMELAMLQGEVLFGHHDTAANSIPPLMDDEYFDDKPFFSTSPELEHAAAYFARKKQYGRAATAALYSGFVQQHYGENKIAMQSFKDAEQFGDMAGDSLAVAMAQYWMGKMLLDDGLREDALVMLKNADKGFGNHLAEKALTQNITGVCYMLQGEYDNAEIFLKQSLIHSEKSHIDRIKRRALNNYAVLYRSQRKFDLSIDYLRQIAGATYLNDGERFTLCLNMGKTFMAAGETDSASVYFQHLEDFLPEVNVKNESKLSAYGALSLFAKRIGKDSLALLYREKHEQLLYDVMQKRQEQSIYRIQKQYDYENLQNILNRKLLFRQRIIMIISILLLVSPKDSIRFEDLLPSLKHGWLQASS